jgi:hypothetical protein
MSDETFAWFVGVDWGSEKHQVCILDQQGTIGGERNFPHSGAGLAELGDWLLSSRLGCVLDQSEAARPVARSVLYRWCEG